MRSKFELGTYGKDSNGINGNSHFENTKNFNDKKINSKYTSHRNGIVDNKVTGQTNDWRNINEDVQNYKTYNNTNIDFKKEYRKEKYNFNTNKKEIP